MSEKSLPVRLKNFILALGAALVIVYVLLPLLTRSFAPLTIMSRHLERTGIDPSRYYYTDVEQVAEGEDYLHGVLEK